MSGYIYAALKPSILTDQGQRMFLKVRDHVHEVLDTAGAIRMDKAMEGAGSGDSWEMLACVDRLVELKEIREVYLGRYVAAQHRIFTRDEA